MEYNDENEYVGADPQEDYQQVNVEESTMQSDNGNGGKNKKNLIIVGAAIVIVGLVIGMICFAMINSAKYTYFKLEKNGINKIIKTGEELEDTGLKRLIIASPENTMKYDVEVAIQAKTEDASAKQFIDIINGTKLILSQQSDYKEGYQSVEGEFSLGGEKIITGYASIDKNIAIAKIPEIYEKYFSADVNNLTPIYELFGVKDTTGLPKKMINQKELLDVITFTEKEKSQIEKSVNNYEKIINKNLKTDDFKIEKDVTFEYNGKEMKCNLVTMTVTPKEAKMIYKEILQELKEDNSVDLVFDKLEKLKKLYEDAGYTDLDELPSKENFYEGIDKELEKIEEDQTDETEGNLISRLYYDGNNILKRELLLEEEELINLTTISNGNEKYYEWVKKSYYSTVVYKDAVIVDKDKEVHNISIESIALNLMTGEEGEKQIQDVCEIIVDKSNKDKTTITIIPDDTLTGVADTQAVIILERINDKKSAASFNAAMKEGTDEIYFDISIIAEEGIKVEKKVISESDNVNLNTISKADFETVKAKMQENIIALTNKISNKIPINGIFPMMTQP